MLPKGDACFPCRKRKVKCDGLKPVCARCQHLRKECLYANGIARRRSAAALEQRALELELKLHRLTLGAAHNLFLAGIRVRARILRLGTLHGQRPVEENPLESSEPEMENLIRSSRALVESSAEPWVSAIFEHVIGSKTKDGFEDLPLHLSHQLITLFLPYHQHFYFFADISRFLERISLPPSHPDSIHPCLLNACYLGACVVVGNPLASLQPFFIKRTQHFLSQALMHADRITHFLWASMVLGNCLARSRRMEEWYAVVSAAAQFASACGLGLPYCTDEAAQNVGETLLPRPHDEIEALDRIGLAHSIYITDQSMRTLTEFSSHFPF
ncbi:hypothetical protein DL93DRAFT_1326573 [Clavulina sp. PMI_390]|nr:hypothetical protein DL93DRAFT_1326573 [Clavulina sp. PMI_390]